MNEFELISRHFLPLAGMGALGLKDDAALVRPRAGHELVLTTDAIVAGVHFVGYEPAHLIAQKLLRVNLSDLAAMGAKPLGYLLALSLPTHTSEKWLADFADGLKACQKEFKLALLGGDTTHTPGTLTLSATLLGTVPQGKALRRNGAKAGDDIYVTGTIGDAALGLKVASGQWSVVSKEKNTDHRSLTTDHLLHRYQLPEPRVTLGQKLRGIANACMDISDGLVQDMGHICAASKLAAEIQWDTIPLSKAARKADNFRETILTGGDDYELLFTAAPTAAGKLKSLGATRIGRMMRGSGVRVLDKNGREIALRHKGYQHF